MNDNLNYYHTSVVIPNMILANKEFFFSKIMTMPRNMEYFITKDTYEKACRRLNLDEGEISCKLTANRIGNYYVVFSEFPDDYRTFTGAIAIAVKDQEFRYFTYEIDNGSYFVGEWQVEGEKIDKHLNYGETGSWGMDLFARKLQDILEG